MHDLSDAMANFRSLVEHIENMLHSLDELEERVINSFMTILKTALLRATTYRKDMTNMSYDIFFLEHFPNFCLANLIDQQFTIAGRNLSGFNYFHLSLFTGVLSENFVTFNTLSITR